jgi:hypothetical protein
MGRVPGKKDRCNVKRHERTHLIESNKYNIKTVHDGSKTKKTKKTECPVCFKKVCFQNLKDHVQNIHNKVKDYECDICKKRFGCKTNVNRHKKEKHYGLKRISGKRRVLNGRLEDIIYATEIFSKFGSQRFI